MISQKSKNEPNKSEKTFFHSNIILAYIRYMKDSRFKSYIRCVSLDSRPEAQPYIYKSLVNTTKKTGLLTDDKRKPLDHWVPYSFEGLSCR